MYTFMLYKLYLNKYVKSEKNFFLIQLLGPIPRDSEVVSV